MLLPSFFFISNFLPDLFCTQAEPGKIGLWGANNGTLHDIEGVPGRLKSVTICSGEVINLLAFSYIDRNGLQHAAGPWGGHGPYAGSDHTINFGPSELLTKVSGTFGPFMDSPADVITSLTFFTNTRSYGPFGHGGGTPFDTPILSKVSIVGFFARTEWYVDAIGIYVHPI